MGHDTSDIYGTDEKDDKAKREALLARSVEGQLMEEQRLLNEKDQAEHELKMVEMERWVVENSVRDFLPKNSEHLTHNVLVATAICMYSLRAVKCVFMVQICLESTTSCDVCCQSCTGVCFRFLDKNMLRACMRWSRFRANEPVSDA